MASARSILSHFHKSQRSCRDPGMDCTVRTAVIYSKAIWQVKTYENENSWGVGIQKLFQKEKRTPWHTIQICGVKCTEWYRCKEGVEGMYCIMHHLTSLLTFYQQGLPDVQPVDGHLLVVHHERWEWQMLNVGVCLYKLVFFSDVTLGCVAVQHKALYAPEVTLKADMFISCWSHHFVVSVLWHL